jgi:hypothetical protein
MKSDTSYAKLSAISRQVFPDSILGVSTGYCQRTLMDESGIIRTQMGTGNRLEMVAVSGTPCAIPHRNSNETYFHDFPAAVTYSTLAHFLC